MLNIFADSFMRATLQEKRPKPRWDMPRIGASRTTTRQKHQHGKSAMIDPIVFLAPMIAAQCGQRTCRVGPAYCCKALKKRR